MRIADIARQALAAKQASSSSSSGTQGVNPQAKRASTGLAAVQEKNQQRLSAAQRGSAAALAVKDSSTAVDKGLSDLKKLVTKASDPSLTASDRDKLQQQFTEGLKKVSDAGTQQGKDLQKEPVATASVGSLDSSTIGLAKKPASGPQTVEDLKKLDLRTASADELKQAGAVLDAAKTQSSAAVKQADVLTNGLGKQAATYERTANALSGAATDAAQQRRAQVVANFTQQNQQQTNPLLNFLA